MNTLRHWKIWGTIAIVLLGGLLHYVYAWSGQNPFLGALVPVNESVWEHLKMGYWALVLFSLLEYPYIKKDIRNYFPAKTLGVLTLELTIILIFYGYTLITGRDIIIIDILSYVFGVIVCQYITFKIFKVKSFPSWIHTPNLILFIAIGLLFVYTTFYPPHVEIFMDTNNQTFGIHQDK